MQPVPRIHVGVVTTSYPIEAGDVSGIFVYRLVKHLSAGIDTTVITPASDKVTVTGRTHSRHAVKIFRYAPRRWQVLAHRGGGIPAAISRNPWLYLLLPILLLAMLLTCLRLARRFNLFHAQWSVNGLVACLAGKFTGKPVLTTLRGSDVNLALKSSLHRFLLRRCVTLSTKVVAVSDSLVMTVRQLIPDAPASKFCVIANGVDGEFLNIPRIAGNETSLLKLVTVGNLTTNKGVDQLLRALQLLAGEKIRLQIVGDGPERENLFELATSLNLQHRVDFVGAVPPGDMVGVMSRADVFVLPSHSEGRPNAMLEAMAAALPVVATDIPGVREIVTTRINGLLFTDGDYRTLATCLKELAHDVALRNDLGTAARQFIITHGYRWRDTADRYIRLYREILSTQAAFRSH